MEWLAIAGVVNSVISAYYYLRVIKVMYLADPTAEERITSGFCLKVAVMTSFAGTVLFGLYPTPLLSLARSAADILVS